MSPKPIITVVIPTYNVEKYVAKCLLSVLDQDILVPIEILVVDDCGYDRSIAIVEQIKSEHKNGCNISIIHHATNKGLGPSRNTGIDIAKGEYIYFLDSDDWIAPNCLSLLYERITETNADFVVGSVVRIEETTERIVSKNTYTDYNVEHEGAGVYMVTHQPDFHIEVWNKLYKTDFLRNNKVRFVHRIFEDYYFDFRLRASSSKIALLSEYTLFYNIRQNSILTSLKANNGTDESVYTFCEIIQYLQDMLMKEFLEVPGIYDLYFQRIIWVFENFARYKYSDKQWSYIDEHVRGFCDFIPSSTVLRDERNLYIYKKICNNESVQGFYRANKSYLNMKKWRSRLNIVKKIKNIIEG